MEINYKKEADYLLISFDDALHMNSNISPLFDRVDNEIENGTKNVVIVFKNDSYLSSRTGATLIKTWEIINEVDGKLALVNVNHNILEFLAIIDLESRILIFDSLDLVSFE